MTRMSQSHTRSTLLLAVGTSARTTHSV